MQVKYIRSFPGYWSNKNPLADIGDYVVAGENMIHTDQMTFKRKPGMRKWSTNQAGESDSPIGLFDWCDGTDQHVIVDGRITIKEYTSTGESTLLAKGGTDNQVAFVEARGVLYASGNSTSAVKHKKIGTANFKSWGIDGPDTDPSISVATLVGPKVRIGWKYRYVYRDSTDGHVSSSSNASSSTGPRAAATVLVTCTGTSNTRVSHIDIYRTRDGGSTFFFLGSVSNPGAATVGFSDDFADTTLNTALICPSTTSNDAPPYMTDVAEHGDRIFGISGNQVVFSSSNVDRIINGIAQECFPPTNAFNFTLPVALVSTQDGLAVLTRSGRAFLITGSSIFDFGVEELAAKYPLASRNCVAKEGSTVYMYTSTREFLAVGPSGVTNFGLALSESDLEDFDPETCYLTVHREGTKSSVYISNADNKTFVYNVLTGTWSPVWEVDGSTVSTGVVRSMQVSGNEWYVIFGPKKGVTGFLWKLDSSINTNDSVTYESYIQLGSTVLAGPDQEVSLEAIFTESSVQPDVAVLIQEVSGSPTSLPTPVGEHPREADTTSLISKRHYTHTIAESRRCRHVQVKVSWDAANDEAELYALGIGYNMQETGGQ